MNHGFNSIAKRATAGSTTDHKKIWAKFKEKELALTLAGTIFITTVAPTAAITGRAEDMGKRPAAVQKINSSKCAEVVPQMENTRTAEGTTSIAGMENSYSVAAQAVALNIVQQPSVENWLSAKWQGFKVWLTKKFKRGYKTIKQRRTFLNIERIIMNGVQKLRASIEVMMKPVQAAINKLMEIFEALKMKIENFIRPSHFQQHVYSAKVD